MLKFVKADRCSHQSGVSKLIYESNPEFYNIFNKECTRLYSDLDLMIKDERTEEFNVHVLMDNEMLIAAVSCYDSSEIYCRQIFSLNYLSSESDIDKEKLKDFSKTVPKVENSSLYLSRITIAEKYRSQGYMKEIIEFLIAEARYINKNVISLHVHSLNQKAINVYLKYGFKVVSDEYEYLIMLKEL